MLRRTLSPYEDDLRGRLGVLVHDSAAYFNGLDATVSTDYPGVVVVHCFAHMLQNAAKMFLDGFPELRQLGKFVKRSFKNSFNRISTMRQICEARGVASHMIPAPRNSLRWFTLGEELQRVHAVLANGVLDMYVAEAAGAPAVTRLREILSNPEFCAKALAQGALANEVMPVL